MDKVILTDCDGVLLDWQTKFDRWVQRQGYRFKENYLGNYGIDEQLSISKSEAHDLIARFNRGSDFESLGPWRDSVEVVQRLHGQGWRFVVITTAGLHPWTYGLRQRNLDRVFGEGVISELHILELHGDKSITLKDFANTNCLWIEDKPSNAELGYKFGLRPLLMNTTFNLTSATTVPRVNNWTEIEAMLNDKR